MSLESLAERIRDAAARQAPLCLRGGGSKDFYGNEPRGEPLDTRGYAGLVSYEPTELVVTARCGTPLAELEAALAKAGQFLPFEPPAFGGAATVGGCVAAGLSGPRRASAGALRDYVLGAKVVDGRGRVLSFGGQVMKNVAGYDVARVFAGSLGTLGLIAEVSLKVLPRPRAEATLALQATQAEALERLNRWAGQPLAISASAWHDDLLCVRLSGAEAAVRAGAAKLGGEAMEKAAADAFWQSIREQQHAFFEGTTRLWRLALPSDAPPLPLPGTQLIEWGGALRWLRGDADPALIREAARTAGGHAMLFRGGKPAPLEPVFSPLDPTVLRLHRELKAAFDPAGILNPGRLVPGL